MEPLYFLGLLIPLLAFLFMRKTKLTKVSNVPEPFLQAMEKAFQSNPKYQNLLNYWLAVSKMETGGYTSHLYRVNNNPWGMKFPRQRQNAVAYQTAEGWASYSNLQNAARDIILWMDAKKFNANVNSLESFIQEMKANGYFEEPYSQYLNLVRAWITR